MNIDTVVEQMPVLPTEPAKLGTWYGAIEVIVSVEAYSGVLPDSVFERLQQQHDKIRRLASLYHLADWEKFMAGYGDIKTLANITARPDINIGFRPPNLITEMMAEREKITNLKI